VREEGTVQEKARTSLQGVPIIGEGGGESPYIGDGGESVHPGAGGAKQKGW